MGKVIIQNFTHKNPISMIGIEAGVCWGADTENQERNYKRGLQCIHDNHGRTLEFPQIYMVLEGYSARVIREVYTHIAGGPTRLQESTRYIDEGNFDYIIPPKILNDEMAVANYEDAMDEIKKYYAKLQKMGIPKEDIANILPLGMTSKIVIRTNLRHLIDMSRQRMCARAYWEYRQLMQDMMQALIDYSPEYATLCTELGVFHAKCDELGYCPESRGCGRYSKLKESKE